MAEHTKTLLEMACWALRSYQFGNSSPDLAEEIADALATELRLQPSVEAVNSHELLLAENQRLQGWVCVYCGHRYGPDSDVPVTMAQVLKDHIEQCPEHPASKLKAENRRLREALESCVRTLQFVAAVNMQSNKDNEKLREFAECRIEAKRVLPLARAALQAKEGTKRP